MAEGENPGDYINQRKDIHDCFFLVGTEKKERISTVKCFLANYSSYFRAMLLETDMREKNSKEDIEIPDHEPDVFKLMLSFVYGCHDIKFKDVNQAMRFHVLADRCLMPRLKKLSTNYLMQNCNSNLCDVLECAVLLQIKEMEPRAKKIVEKDTKALLSSPDFLNAHPAIVEFIVKQEGLSVTEVELWRALVKWAKQQCGNTGQGSVIRKKIYPIMKHVEFLKMTLKEFAEEVVPTSILTPSETISIFVNMATGKGNPLQEARSKTRRDRSCNQTSTYVLSFGDNLVMKTVHASSYNCMESTYEITNVYPGKLRIDCIELINFTPEAIRVFASYYGNINVCVKLVSKDERCLIAEHIFPAIKNTSLHSYPYGTIPKVLELRTNSDGFIIDAFKSYRLHIRIPNNQWYQMQSTNISKSWGTVNSCDLCTVHLLFFNPYGTRKPERGSVIQSITISKVDP